MSIKREDRRFVDFIKDDSRLVLYSKRVQDRIRRDLGFERFFSRLGYMVLPLSVIVSAWSLFWTKNKLADYEEEIRENNKNCMKFVAKIKDSAKEFNKKKAE